MRCDDIPDLEPALGVLGQVGDIATTIADPRYQAFKSHNNKLEDSL
jgi:hypothetical protein